MFSWHTQKYMGMQTSEASHFKIMSACWILYSRRIVETSWKQQNQSVHCQVFTTQPAHELSYSVNHLTDRGAYIFIEHWLVDKCLHIQASFDLALEVNVGWALIDSNAKSLKLSLWSESFAPIVSLDCCLWILNATSSIISEPDEMTLYCIGLSTWHVLRCHQMQFLGKRLTYLN